ncbi:MAG TPA: ligase-associated DNA damage response endonuclease PdeM [Flavitalea sp.]|nr:ligase-associated DNA damage response endonuclease PdeM [Flavitalea sp.]
MQPPRPYTIHKQQLWISPDRALYWEEQRSLIVSDLHFGKTGHFRKAGIPVPPAVFKEDLQRLFNQIQYFQPKTLVVVGDLFHSNQNKELDLFLKWREDLKEIQLVLIKGNHDILHESWYVKAAIEVKKGTWQVNNFCFSHDMETCESREYSYLFSGHIHPGIVINGLGKQSLRFPCFYFAKTYCVLPAFSRFTGVSLIDPQPGEEIFAIVNNSIVHM